MNMKIDYSKHNIPVGYTKIKVHLIFDTKNDDIHKETCISDGHIADIPVESV